METVIAYFDETGDDGFVNSSSQDFVLTSIYTKTENWQKNFNAMKNCRALLKEKYGFRQKEKLTLKKVIKWFVPFGILELLKKIRKIKRGKK